MKTGPLSEHGVLLAALFLRRAGTPFSPKEERALKVLEKGGCFDDIRELVLVIQYHKAERKKGAKGIQRRDLFTFLNNYHGELDRARAWAEKNPEKVVRQVTQNREQPERWPAFLEEVYPEARVTDFYQAPTSVQLQFRQWEKEQL